MDAESEEGRSSYAATVRRQLEHEDGLMVNRLSWLVASQSFLFTAYAIVLNGVPQAQNLAAVGRQELLRSLLPTLGLATCGLIYLGVLAGVRVTNVLRREFRQRRNKETNLEETILGTATTHALGLAAPLLLPPLFSAAWATLLLWNH